MSFVKVHLTEVIQDMVFCETMSEKRAEQVGDPAGIVSELHKLLRYKLVDALNEFVRLFLKYVVFGLFMNDLDSI